MKYECSFMEYQKEKGRIRANSNSRNENRPNLVDFKVSYDLQKRGLVLKSWKQNFFHFEFWTIIFCVIVPGLLMQDRCLYSK